MPFSLAKQTQFTVRTGFVKFTELRDRLRELGSAIILDYGIDFEFETIELKKWKSDKLERVLFINFLEASEFVTGRIRTIFSEWHDNADLGDIKLYLEYVPGTADTVEKVRIVMTSGNAAEDGEAILIHVHDMVTPTNSKWSVGANYRECFTYVPKEREESDSQKA